MSLHPAAAYQAAPSPHSLQKLSADLSASINQAVKHKSYSDVVVLAFHWENDETGVIGLETHLLDVFRQPYNFKVESFTIPLVLSQMALLQHLLQLFQQHQGDDVLRIVIYSGHANAAGRTVFDLELAGRIDSHGRILGPRLNWWAVRDFLNSSIYPGDTCYIFDCCSGASSALGDHNGDELVAACEWDQIASASIAWSFTQALIDTLRDLGGRPATLAQIYATLFRRAQQSQVGSCPVHVPNPEKPSVTIGRVDIPRSSLRSDRHPNEYRILISAKVREELPTDPARWKAWLGQNILPEILSADITIEAAFRGSGVLLIAMPVEIWTMMPRKNPAYSFVGHVTSHNITPLSQATPLPIRPAQLPGRENSPLREIQRHSSPDKRNR